jgi:hypothetical protein
MSEFNNWCLWRLILPVKMLMLRASVSTQAGEISVDRWVRNEPKIYHANVNGHFAFVYIRPSKDALTKVLVHLLGDAFMYFYLVIQYNLKVSNQWRSCAVSESQHQIRCHLTSMPRCSGVACVYVQAGRLLLRCLTSTSVLQSGQSVIEDLHHCM